MKQKFTLYVLLALLATTKTNITHAQVSVQDSLALVDLYNSTDGPHWKNHTNWLTTNPVSTWYGEIFLSNDRVTYLSLSNNNLNGIIPSSMGNLTMLTDLYLDYNKLHDTLPHTLSNLLNLNQLFLSYNQLTGNIPEGIGKPLESNEVHLDHNQFTGHIPASLLKTFFMSIYKTIN